MEFIIRSTEKCIYMTYKNVLKNVNIQYSMLIRTLQLTILLFVERKDVFILKKKMYANIFILNVIL